ncbi:MAG: choice-of-anchor L domain-containing protein [Lyngbya sp.]|nr:choice-of-anchor L domain-containing protein [Lyngbya sp.]
MSISSQNSVQNLISSIQRNLQKDLYLFSKKSKFDDNIKLVFGELLDVQKLEELRQKWLREDFSQFPNIELRTHDELGQAKAAFSSQTNTIYLSSDFLNANFTNPQVIYNVLAEETGHFIDNWINSSDTPGDEGAYFASIFQNQSLTPSSLNLIKTENDLTVLNLDNQEIIVEKADTYLGDNLELIESELNQFFLNLEDSLTLTDFSQNLPIIGNVSENISTQATNFIGQIRESINNQFEEIEPENLTSETIQLAFLTALGEEGLNLLTEDNLDINETSDNLQFNLTLNTEPVILTNTPLNFAEGIPGINLSINGEAQTALGLEFNLNFGVNSTEGFYIDTETDQEINLNLKATTPDLEATGTLGLLTVDVTDEDADDNPENEGDIDNDGINPTQLESSFIIDIQTDDNQLFANELDENNLFDLIQTTINGSADLNFNLKSSADLPLLPSIKADFNLNWSDLLATPSISFNNVALEADSFLNQFASPILDGINTVTEPLTPFINALQKEVPIVDQTVLEFVQQLLGLFPGYFDPETLEFIDDLGNVLILIEQINNISANGAEISLGNFNLVDGTITPNVVSDALEQINNLGLDLGNDEFVRFEFPILSEPESIIQLFLGESEVEFFRIDLPALGFGVSYEQSFPIFGPFVYTLGGDFGAAANLSFGFDSYGFELFKDSEFTSPELITQGFFISTPDSPDNLPPVFAEDEVFTTGLGVGVNAGVGIDLGIADFGINGGLIAQLFVNLAEEKVRVSDFADPGCLLIPEGKFDAIVSAKLRVGFGPFGFTKRFELARATIADFRAGCSGSTEDHQQATVDGDGNAILSVGEQASNLIDIEGNSEDEVFAIASLGGELGNETIEVTAYGANWSYENVTQIIADAGSGNDIIDLNNVLSPAQLTGGTGDDQFFGGFGNDSIEGGSDQDFLEGGKGDDSLVGGDGDDFLSGSQGDDTLDGGSGFDAVTYFNATNGVEIDLSSDEVGNVLDGDGGRDTLINIEQIDGSTHNDEIIGDDDDNVIDGLEGDDQLAGSDGDDFLIGGPGQDTLNGGTEGNQGDATSYIGSIAAVAVNLDSGEVFSGGGSDADGDRLISIENIQGSGFDDTLIGDDGDNRLDGSVGDDTLDGGVGEDTLDGGGVRSTSSGGGSDWITYIRSPQGVEVNLKTGETSGGHAQGDRLEFAKRQIAASSDQEEPELVVLEGEFSSFENLEGSPNNDSLSGDLGNNIIRGLAGEDTLSGDGGNDTLIGGENGDSFEGGLGLDWVDYRDASAVVVANLVNGGSQGEANGDTFTTVENLRGSDRADSLIGDENDNEIDPGLSSGAIADFVDGGSQNERGDRLFVDYSRRDTGTGIIGGFVKEFEDTEFDFISRRISPNNSILDRVNFENIEHITVIGTVQSDQIDGGEGDDVLMLGAGDDTVYGGFGNNRILAGEGNDFVVDQNDSTRELIVEPEESSLIDLNGGSGVDTLSVNLVSQRDLNGNSPDIILEGTTPGSGSQNQLYTSPDGTIAIQNFEVFQNIKTGEGSDRIVQPGAVNNIFFTEGGNDFIDSGDGIDLVYGGDDNDELYGGGDTDFVIGGAGDDSLSGEAGDDVLIGIAFGTTVFPATEDEIDILNGGSGADQFWLGDGVFAYYYDYLPEQGDNHGIITDFNPGEGDVIFLNGSSGDYDLVFTPTSTEIYLTTELFDNFRVRELIGIVEGVTNFNLNARYVRYVDDNNPSNSTLIPPAFNTLVPTEDLSSEPATVLDTFPSNFQFSNPSNNSSSESSEQFTIQNSEPNPLLSDSELTIEPVQAFNNSDSSFEIISNNNLNELTEALLGNTEGLSNINVKLEGNAEAFGEFYYDPFGLDSGVVISTGKVEDLVGENQADGGLSPGINLPLTFTKLNSSNTNTGVFRANLSELGFDLNSLTLADSGSETGGAPGVLSGFDLDFIKLSSVAVDSAEDINQIPSLGEFDFSPAGTFLTPGTQRSSNSNNNPVEPNLFGTINSTVNNAVATLDRLDYSGTNALDSQGTLSLGDGGKISFNLQEAIASDELYLYIGEAANNGESINGQITASNQRVGQQRELSTDFGLPGVDNDKTSIEITFDADETAEQLFLQFVFGSEEFVEFGGKEFNDNFDIKLNGFNLARLSDGATTNINNLVSSPLSEYHPDFIYNSVDEGVASDLTPLDGYTEVLNFAGLLKPNAKNSLTIEIKDIGDGELDSAAFIKANSIGTSPIPQGSVTVVPTEGRRLTVAELGESNTLEVVLDSVPKNNVTVTLDPDEQLNLGQGANQPIQLTFSPENALIPQTVNVSAFNDSLVEGNHQGFIEVSSSSEDPQYDQLNFGSVTVDIRDNDFILNPIPLPIPQLDLIVNSTNIDESFLGSPVESRLLESPVNPLDLESFSEVLGIENLN